MPDVRERITKTDGTTDNQVGAMAELNTRVGATLAEASGIFSIGINSLEERPEANVK